MYEGTFVAGLKSTPDGGRGRMTYQHGDEYVGEWRDDREHGMVCWGCTVLHCTVLYCTVLYCTVL